MDLCVCGLEIIYVVLFVCVFIKRDEKWLFTVDSLKCNCKR